MKPKKTTKAKKIAAGFAVPNAPVRAEVKPEAAQAFEGGAPVPEAKPNTAKSRSRRKLSVADLERVNAWVPIALATELRVRCATNRISLSEAVTEALLLWMLDGQSEHGARVVAAAKAAAK